MDKKTIINKAFEYVRTLGDVHTQKDLALKMGYSTPTISSAFKGDPRYLTESFISNFNKTFGDIFNPEWLASGEGEMLSAIKQPCSVAMPPSDEYIAELRDRILEQKNMICDLRRINLRLEAEIDRLNSRLDENGRKTE